MESVLVYGAVLLLAALLSARAQRTAFSTSVLFIGAGFLAGWAGWVKVDAGDRAVRELADLALFVVLFADGMRLGFGELRRTWTLPGRALIVGLPLTLLAIAALGHFAAGLAWGPAVLLAGVLTPTDPVFASAIVNRDDAPHPLRRLLNVESGFNDGLALPIVLGMVALLGPKEQSLWKLLGEVAGGALLGSALAWMSERLRRMLAPEVAESYSALFVLAVGVLAYASARLLNLNEYLAAFCAGMALASASPQCVQQFHGMGEHLSHLLKFAALLAFGAMLSPATFGTLQAGGWLFIAGVLLVARPVAMAIALMHSSLGCRERAAAAWFGPKGFASVVYAMIVLRSGLGNAALIFQLAAVAVAVSVIAHSTTDVPMARWLARQDGGGKS